MKIYNKGKQENNNKNNIIKHSLDDFLDDIRLKELQKEADILNQIPEDRIARGYDKRYR